MRLISVVAPANGAGKTRAVCTLLGAFSGQLAAVKFTTVYRDGVNCPRSERLCACRSLHGRFTIMTDPAVLHQEGTDTHRMARSGARSVTWCLAVQGAHREAWDHLRATLLEPGADLVIEGNSIVEVIDPDRVIMILSPTQPESRWKPGTWALLRRADRVYINTHGASPGEIETLARRVAPERGGERVEAVDVSMPLSSWPGPPLADDLGRLLGRRAGAAR